MGNGCLVDQLLGQFIADLAGLGPLLNVANMRTALASIYKYNYKRNMYNEESVERAFAVNDQAALILCDYTKGDRPEVPMPYYSENFTGSEYAAAILMMKYGAVKNAVWSASPASVERFDGEQSNPYCEVEWGRHYARAMASWGADTGTPPGFCSTALTQELEMKTAHRCQRLLQFLVDSDRVGKRAPDGPRGQLKICPGAEARPDGHTGKVRTRFQYIYGKPGYGDRGRQKRGLPMERHGADALFVFQGRSSCESRRPPLLSRRPSSVTPLPAVLFSQGLDDGQRAAGGLRCRRMPIDTKRRAP